MLRFRDLNYFKWKNNLNYGGGTVKLHVNNKFPESIVSKLFRNCSFRDIKGSQITTANGSLHMSY